MIAIGKNSSTAQKLFSLAEKHLARTLSYTDMNTIIGVSRMAKTSIRSNRTTFYILYRKQPLRFTLY